MIYLIFMWVGATIVRIPAPGWKPEGYTPPVVAQKLITRNDVYVYDAIKTPQFWLIWWVLCRQRDRRYRRARPSLRHEPGNVPG